MEMPEWLRQPGEKPTEASEVPTEEVIGLVKLSLEPDGLPVLDNSNRLTRGRAMPMREEGKPSELPTEEAAKPEVQPGGGEADMISWLERLSEDQESSLKEALPSPEKIPEATADKNQQISDTQPTVKLTKNRPLSHQNRLQVKILRLHPG